MFSIQPRTLYKWYRNHLSDYYLDIESKKWHPKYLEKVDMDTGQIEKGKPLYVFKPENIGDTMSIDDKNIGHEGFTIMSNGCTGKIALMIESCKSEEVSEAVSLFGKDLLKIKNISCDMAAGYLMVCEEQLPQAKVVVDKFHVMQHVYDAVLDVRTRIKKKISTLLSKGKTKTEDDKKILASFDVLKHCRYRLTQSPEKWSMAGKEVMNQVFENHPELKTAYHLAQSFKQWYDISNRFSPQIQIAEQLQQWYSITKTTGLEEFKSVIKMIRKHENQILNYFSSGLTSAKAERLNGKINRFITNSYGIKDKDFALYRTAHYFS